MNGFEFSPTLKIFLGTNHKPVIKGTENAIWRRIHLVPFDITIPEKERDKHLLEKLEKEFPGILTWAVSGCRDWQKNGLEIPDGIKSATDQYRGEMDVLEDFIKERCILGQEFSVLSKEIYDAYLQWCEENKEASLKRRAFGMRLREKGLANARAGAKGDRVWAGIRLSEQSM